MAQSEQGGGEGAEKVGGRRSGWDGEAEGVELLVKPVPAESNPRSRQRLGFGGVLNY